MELDFDKIFKIPTIALHIGGAHPYIPKDRKWAFKFFIVHGEFTLAFIALVYNIFYHNLKENNFSQMCKNGVLVVVYVVITFQYCVLLRHQSSLIGLINDMNKDYKKSQQMNPEEKAVLLKYVNLGVRVCKQWLFIPLTASGTFLVKNLTLMFYYYCIGEFKLVPFFDLVYPSVIEENKDNFIIYLLTYALIFLFGCYSSLMYVAYVPLGPIFMLHACGQLELVKNQIDDLFVECDEKVIKRKLKIIIVQLQYIYGFVERIKGIFMVAYELTLKGSTMMLPITSYEIVEALKQGEISVEFITFIFAATLISSSPCYYSDLLMEKGEMVRMALYSCGWERYYDRRTRTTLQFMLQNALRPIVIKTIFRVLCLDALTDLFQQSYAIFNLMNAMWN